MKRRIEQLLNGIFEYEAPKMLISETGIHAVIRKGESFRGSFTVESSTQKKMKGFLYSSSPRMGYEPTDFVGISEKIVYEADTAGMEEGDVLEGDFTICSDMGEYRIPYRIEVARSLVKTSTDVIGDLNAFSRLAQQDFQKAYVLFLSAGFRKMLHDEAPQWVPLYEGLMAQAVSYSSLEEFLIGIQEKSPIVISTDKKGTTFGKLYQPEKALVALTKSTWGFLRLDISTDGDFLKVERPIVTTDEFIGSTYNLEYLINTEKLHAGRNYGRIKISSAMQEISYEVVVVKQGIKGNNALLRKQHKQVANLMNQYIEFRLHKRNLNTWILDSQEALEEYHQSEGSHTMLELYQAHLFFAADKAENACMILENLEEHKEKLNTPDILGYYLYLTTFYNKEKEYIDYVEESINGLLRQNPENWKLQWILMYLQESLLSHPAEKLEAIHRQFLYGCRSRIMYLEAYHVIDKSPLLLKKLGDFEIQILRFLCREELLNGEIIMQVSDLAGRHKEYSRELYEILTACYQVKPSDSLLGIICSLLIKGNKQGKQYFSWYEKAVEADLRITGLYEYYVESMGNNREHPLPRIIKMYFSYNNTLNYKKKALVYANVIQHRETDPHTYQNYRPTIEKFMVDQLLSGRINRDLALIYQTFLTRSVLNRKMAKYLAKALFTYEIRCEASKIRYAVVLHRELKKEQKVPFSEQTALIQLYTKDYQILLEDEEGMRYSTSFPYKLTRLLEEPDFMDYCQEIVPESPELILYTCGQAKQPHPVKAENVEHFCYLLEIEEVKDAYKELIRQEILDYYYENQAADTLYEYLHRIDYEEFIKTDKKKLIELLTAEGMCQEAFELVGTYGPENVGLISLVRMCSRNILNREFEEDEMLVAICYYCYAHEKYDETVLSYLVKYYDGPIENMKGLWRAARQFELDTFDLEEKLLMVVLFMRKGAQDTEEIFDAYRRKLGKKKLLMAYTVYRAYDYFVKEVPVKGQVFEYIERGYEKGNYFQDICLLALLLWYSRQEALKRHQEEYVQKLLEEFTCKNMRFGFLKQFPVSLIRPFQLQDKSFVEYRANPSASVHITWHLEKANGEKTREVTEPMKNVYEGVFEKEVTLFYGEKLVYTIGEENSGVQKEKYQCTLEWDTRNSTEDNTCYDLLNRLAASLEKKDKKAADGIIQTYLEQECLVEHLFTLT